MIKVLIRIGSYKRTSTERQEKDETILTQELALITLLEQRFGVGNYEIVGVYEDDGYTGTNMDRPGLQRMLQDAGTDLWDVLVTYDPSRLSRDFTDGLSIVEELMAQGKQIIYKDGSSPNLQPRIMNRVMAAVHDDERERTVNKFLDGKKKRAEQKRIMNSTAAYGYTLIPMVGRPGRQDYADTKIIINPVEADVARLIFHLIGNERYSSRMVIKKLMELGIKPKKSSRNVWATSSIYNMIKNEVYIGKLRYGSSVAVEPKRRIKKVRKKNIIKTSRIIKPRDQWQYMEVPPILEGSEGVLLFQRAQDQLKRNRREAKGGKDPYAYLLSGRIECSCGYARCGEGSKASGNLYYRCASRISNFPERLCELGGVRAIDADTAVWNHLAAMVTTPTVFHEAIEEYFSGASVTPVNESEIAINVLTREQEILTKGRSQLETALQKEVLDFDRFEVLYKENKQKLIDVEEKLRQVSAVSDESDIPVVDPYLIPKIILYAKEALKEISLEDRRQFVLDVVTKIVAIPGKLSVEGMLPVVQNWSYDAIILPLRQNKAKIPSPFYYVQFKTISRHRWTSQRWKINIIYGPHQK